MNGIKTAVRVNGFAEASMEYLLDLFHIKTYGYKPSPSFDHRPMSHSDTYLLNELNDVLGTEGLVGKPINDIVMIVRKQDLEALNN